MMRLLLHSFFILLFCILIAPTCNAQYSCYVRNKTSEVIYLKTKPVIENASRTIPKNSPLEKPMYGQDSTATYTLKPNDVVLLQRGTGAKPVETSFPYTYLEIIYNTQKDTIRYSSKKSIINTFKKEGEKADYYISVQ